MVAAINPVSVSNAFGLPNATAAQQAQLFATYAQLQNTSLLTRASNDNTTNTSGILGSANLVNLSPAALNILNGIDTNTTGAVNSTLTPEQQQSLTAIVNQFSGQPLTQENFLQLQNALQAAGFDPQQLSLQSIFLAFNSPLSGINGALYGQLFAQAQTLDLTEA